MLFTNPAMPGQIGKKIEAMQVTETLAEGLKHEFKVSVPASDIDAKWMRASPT